MPQLKQHGQINKEKYLYLQIPGTELLGHLWGAILANTESQGAMWVDTGAVRAAVVPPQRWDPMGAAMLIRSLRRVELSVLAAFRRDSMAICGSWTPTAGQPGLRVRTVGMPRSVGSPALEDCGRRGPDGWEPPTWTAHFNSRQAGWLVGKVHPADQAYDTSKEGPGIFAEILSAGCKLTNFLI